MHALTLELLDGTFDICRYPAGATIPPAAYESNFLSITKTDEELSIVCDATIALEADSAERGWSCLKVQGPLAFELTGILARISGALAEAEISIFALSTYDTDYILVKYEMQEAAVGALEGEGYVVR